MIGILTLIVFWAVLWFVMNFGASRYGIIAKPEPRCADWGTFREWAEELVRWVPALLGWIIVLWFVAWVLETA